MRVIDIIISSKQGAIIRTIASTDVTLDDIIMIVAVVVAVDGHFRPRAGSCIRAITTHGVIIAIPTDAVTISAIIIIIIIIVIIIIIMTTIAVVVIIIIVVVKCNIALTSCSQSIIQQYG